MTINYKPGKENSTRMKILIAEDHGLTAKLLSSLLAQNDRIEIIGVVGDGQQVLRAVDRYLIDIVLLDLSMPVLDGLQTMKKLFEKTAEVKVLVLSGHSDSRFIEKSLSLGASGYVTKKVDTNELIQALITVHSGGNYLDKASLDALVINAKPNEYIS